MTKPVTISVDVDSIPLPLVLRRVQTLGEWIDKIREERKYLQGRIADRLRAGESEHDEAPVDEQLAAAFNTSLGDVVAERVDGVAPGAVIDVWLKAR